MHMRDVLRSLHSENTKERIATCCTGGMNHWDSRTFAGRTFIWIYCIWIYMGFLLGSHLYCQADVNEEAARILPIKKSCPLHKEIIHPCLSTALLTLQCLEWHIHCYGLVAGRACGCWATRHGQTSLQEWGLPPLGLLSPWPRSSFTSFSKECPSVFCRRKVKSGCPERGRSSSCHQGDEKFQIDAWFVPLI